MSEAVIPNARMAKIADGTGAVANREALNKSYRLQRTKKTTIK